MQIQINPFKIQNPNIFEKTVLRKTKWNTIVAYYINRNFDEKMRWNAFQEKKNR